MAEISAKLVKDLTEAEKAVTKEIEEPANKMQESSTVHVPQPDGSDICIDTETGEVIEEPQNTTDELIAILFNILQEDFEVQLS